MVELIINGKTAELKKQGSEIKYTMQIADILDIASVAASYTNSFSLPKTPNNTHIFQQLGIIGDTSQVPYSKIPVTLKNHGYNVISDGWLDIKETTSEYKVSIINGMIDFFKAIDNKTIGADLDLSNFSHLKTVENVINSYDNEYYKYIVADYNGKNTIGIAVIGGVRINIDYLVPSFSVKKLFDLIFETYGFTYDISDIEYINGLYITYPLPPQTEITKTHIAVLNKTNYSAYGLAVKYNRKYAPSQTFWTFPNVSEGELIDNWYFKVPQTGGYNINLNVEAYGKINTLDFKARADIYVNGVQVNGIDTESDFTPVELDFNITLNQGDIVEYFLSMPNTASARAIIHQNTNLNIYKIDLGDVSLENAFKDFKIKDFFKEILWRTGLTPVINSITNHVSFVPMSYRLNFDNAIDWSDKYVKRLKEKYKQGEYGQKNLFQLKHNNESDTKGNGYLNINNQNLPDEVKLVESKLYAPETDGFYFPNFDGDIMFYTDKYRIWEREINEEGDEFDITYKGLSNRFYFLRLNESPVSTYRLMSEFLETAENVDRVYYASNEETLLSEAIFTNYQEYEQVLNNFRIHEIELALSLNDILRIDLTVPYFFAKEGQYYMINKIDYQEGTTSKGEFVRINKLQ